MYSSETWGFHDSLDIERVHVKCLKQLLGVRSQTCNFFSQEKGAYFKVLDENYLD